MGLNDAFDHVRNQMLVMDTPPSVNKAYSMILRIEKQMEVHIIFGKSIESSVLSVHSKIIEGKQIMKGNPRKETISRNMKGIATIEMQLAMFGRQVSSYMGILNGIWI